jgi:hypothetical protein
LSHLVLSCCLLSRRIRVAADRRFRVNGNDVVGRIVDGEGVVFNLASGMYYGLDPTGALVWTMVERHHSSAEVASMLAALHGLDLDQVSDDVEHLVDELLAESLIEPDERLSPAPLDDGSLVGPSHEYRAPVLEKYSDMQELLALDPPMPTIEDLPRTAWG